MQLCEGSSSNIYTIDDVRFDVKQMDNGQKDKISFMVMGMDTDEDNKNVASSLFKQQNFKIQTNKVP
jgi:hypothetical protein